MDLNNVNTEFETDAAHPDPTEQDEPTTTAPTDHLLAAVLSKFDSLETRLNALANSRPSNKSAGAPKAKTATPAAKAPTKLTDAERERCHRENRCLRCREKGHWGNECPVFGAKRLNA